MRFMNETPGSTKDICFIFEHMAMKNFILFFQICSNRRTSKYRYKWKNAVLIN
jgi:hypothetical protein